MRMKFVYMMFVLAAFCLMPMSKGMADQGQKTSEIAQFFTSIHDMPLMPGLVELPDQTVAFDKPQGRIIEAIAQINSGSFEEIQLYYESILPQFGWSVIEGNAFIRGDERLQMSFETYEEQQFLRMMVMPR